MICPKNLKILFKCIAGIMACVFLWQQISWAADLIDTTLTKQADQQAQTFAPSYLQSQQSAAEAMEPLGVVNVAMREALVAMRQAGALAAKQTGAGMGGMLLGLCASEVAAQAVATALAPRSRAFWTLAIYPEKS